MEHSRYLRMLIFIETQVEMHSTIRKFKSRNGQSNITYIDIPKDKSMDWNEIPKKLPAEEWKRIEDPILVEKYIIERNKRHLNQAQETPCTIEPLQSLLGLDSRTPFGNSVLEGTVDLTQLPLTNLQKLYFKEMKKTEKPLLNKVKNKISLDEMTYAFTKWKERTTTSPSGRHLGHYKALTVSDGEDNNEVMKAFSFEMLSSYNVIINAALALGTPLQRWERSIVLMIEKEKNCHRINRLRVINIYEADYNLILKYFWPHKTTQFAERNNLLGENQWGGRPLCNADNVAMIDEMNTECHRMTCCTLCTFQNDAIGCFDRMIPSHSMLNSRKFGVPDQVCTLHARTLENTKYFIKPALGTSTKSYQSTKDSKIYGQGQGAGSSGSSWTFISVPMMTTLEKSSLGCKIISPNKKIK